MGGTSDFTPWNDIIDLHPKYDRLITDLIFEKTPEREIRGDQL